MGSEIRFGPWKLPNGLNLDAAIHQFTRGVECWCHGGARPDSCSLDGECHWCLLCNNFWPGRDGFTPELKLGLFTKYAELYGKEFVRNSHYKTNPGPNDIRDRLEIVPE